LSVTDPRARAGAMALAVVPAVATARPRWGRTCQPSARTSLICSQPVTRRGSQSRARCAANNHAMRASHTSGSPAISLEVETGGFASPPRGGFALVTVRAPLRYAPLSQNRTKPISRIARFNAEPVQRCDVVHRSHDSPVRSSFKNNALTPSSDSCQILFDATADRALSSPLASTAVVAKYQVPGVRFSTTTEFAPGVPT
jgi:hypothetical protein